MSVEALKRYAAFHKNVISPLRTRQGEVAVCRRLEDLLDKETTSDVRRQIMGDLAIYSFYSEGRDESLKWKWRAIEEWQDDPLIRGSLANWYHTHRRKGVDGQSDLQNALNHNAEAIALARKQGDLWLRYVLFDRCRIAVEVERLDIIEESMEAVLATLPVDFETADIPYLESDWLKDLPNDTLDASLIERYLEAEKAAYMRCEETFPGFFTE